MKSIQDRPFEALNVVVEQVVVPPPVEEIKRIDKSPLHSSKGKSAESAFLPIAVKIGTTYHGWTWHVRNKRRAEMPQPRPRRDSKLTSIRLADAIHSAMIPDTKTGSRNTTWHEAVMSTSKVIRFGEKPNTMTYEEGFAFIDRTRRQLDRFEVALPHGEGQTISPEDAAAIRRQLDELERDFRKDLETI
jgi:hypothetical protein